MKLGFIGLGRMGREMAGRLLDAGHGLIVYNRSPAAAESFASRGAQIALTRFCAPPHTRVISSAAD